MPSTKYEKLFEDVRPLANEILVTEMQKGEKLTRGGLIIPDDNGKDRGIKPRWAKVYKVGRNVDYVKPGEYILVEHGRWTYGIEMILSDDEGNETKHYLQRVDTAAILLVSEEEPSELKL